MPITIDLPPAMVQEAEAFAQSQNTTLQQLVVDYIGSELNHRREVQVMLSRLDKISNRVNARLSGEPYKFNRADAYEPEIPYA
ncbi:MAG: hypothetical protein IKO40_13870 [Kiritimatiellae bacterium]|nr:hypothetical protein [Kiritimatiellia bacterium]